LDGSDAEAHAALGEIAAMLNYDWESAKKHFQSALELAPSTYVRCSYAIYFLIPLGRIPEALVQAERVIANDPLSVMGHQLQAAAYMFAKDFAAAERCCSRALELIDTFPRGLQMMAMVKSFQGQHAEAIKWAERLLQVVGRTYLSLHTLAMTKAAAGHCDAAESVLAELTSLPAIDQLLPTGVGLVKLILGDVDAAIGWLTKAVEQREPSVLWVHMLPRGPLLLPDPRFKNLLKQMHLVNA
jgi:tetratricopeptide (TPR) repeat protein